MAINGVILVNKARGVSSNKVVNKVKYALNTDKAGHLGTLDVLGEGLLPVTLGKGTKLFDYYLHKDKIYNTVFKFGETTDTLDLEGEITQHNDVTVTLQDLKAVTAKFEGKYAQMPPAYSAKKINGQKAYNLARAGQQVELKPKEIEIYSIQVLRQVADNTFELQVHCSSGTYIRSLCRDLAQALSTYGVMLSIQRTKCGDFSLEQAYTLDEIENGNYNIIQLDTLFDYPSITLTPQQEERLLNGVKIDLSADNEWIKVYGSVGFIGIGHNENNKLTLNLRLI